MGKKKQKEISMIRSSAAEYLTFITATGESDVNAIYFDENVWLTQKMMGLLYNVETHTINYHLKKYLLMARIVNAYLDLAELRAEEQIPMTMEDWAEQFEGVLRLSRKDILTHAGSISAKMAEQHALSEFEKYRVKQDQLYQSDFDKVLIEDRDEKIIIVESN